jgi:hypothetical protein
MNTNGSATPRRATRGVARAVGLLMLIGSGVSPIARHIVTTDRTAPF